jgi:hypothetical protein
MALQGKPFWSFLHKIGVNQQAVEIRDVGKIIEVIQNSPVAPHNFWIPARIFGSKEFPALFSSSKIGLQRARIARCSLKSARLTRLTSDCALPKPGYKEDRTVPKFDEFLCCGACSFGMSP